MKRIVLFAAVLALCSSVSIMAANHRQAYALKGEVKEAAVIAYNVVMEDGEFQFTDRDETADTVFMKFDKQGRLLEDHMHNIYTWDSKGNFKQGNFPYSKIKCDKNGRVVEYEDIDPDGEGETDTDFTLTYTYDAAGRLIKVVQEGYAGCFEGTYTYDSNGYLIGEKFKGDQEGGVVWSTDIEYNNMEFDEHGNWTVRLVSMLVNTQEEGEEPVSDSSYAVERCEIVYY